MEITEQLEKTVKLQDILVDINDRYYIVVNRAPKWMEDFAVKHGLDKYIKSFRITINGNSNVRKLIPLSIVLEHLKLKPHQVFHQIYQRELEGDSATSIDEGAVSNIKEFNKLWSRSRTKESFIDEAYRIDEAISTFEKVYNL